MQGMVRILALATSMVLAAFNQAYAWGANVEGPDVFGNVKVFAGEGGDRESLVVQCDSKNTLFLAWIIKKKEFQQIDTVPVTFVLATSGDKPILMNGVRRNWNDNYMAFSVDGDEASILDALNAVHGARGPIQVGVEMNGTQFSSEFSSRGSTAAMNTVFDKCALANRSDGRGT